MKTVRAASLEVVGAVAIATLLACLSGAGGKSKNADGDAATSRTIAVTNDEANDEGANSTETKRDATREWSRASGIVHRGR